ncbi:MAG: endolytic transglycosylase MltG, partial [Bacteroidaceae bacterium]|nr:endolytic transglycosylase MltG [Bacteroidaceae bacterium]
MKQTITAIISILFLLSAGIGAYSYVLLKENPFQIKERQYIYIDSDDIADSVRMKVEIAGRPKTMLGFQLMCKLKRYSDSPRTGRYAIEPGTCMFDLVRQLANGIQTPVKLTVPEARTVDSVVGRIAKQLMVDSAAIAQILNNEDYIKELGYDKQTLPCLFIPNTYEVYWNISAEKLIQRLQKEKERFWNKTRVNKASAIGLTIEQVATLASIVESESSYSP